MLMNASGHLQVTVVDGSTLTGIFAADGSLNVFDATNETGFVGLQHPCGAINCVSSSGTTLTGAQAPNGGYYVVNDSAEIGLRHSSGGLCVTNFTTTEAVSFLSTWGPYGMVMDFTDASIAIKDSLGVLDYTSNGQISNGAPVGPGAKLTYSATSAKLTEQSDGQIKFQAHNIAFPSHSSSTGFTATNLTVTTGIADPQGGTAALRLQSTSTFGTYFRDFTGVTGATFSNEVLIRAVNVTGAVNLYNPDASITDIGPSLTSDWQKFTASAGVTSSSLIRWRIALANAGDIVEIVNLHVRRTPSVDTYIATTTAAAYDLPYVYSGGEKIGVAFEPAATNLCLRSTAFDNASWSKAPAGTGSAAVVTTGFTSPSGTNDACRIDFALNGGTTTGDRSEISQTIAGAATYSNSIWLKADAPVTISFRDPSNSGVVNAIDITTSWQRFSATAVAAASTNLSIGIRGGSGYPDTASVYAWAAQVETGTVATSPIITYGASVLRAADSPEIPTSLFPYNIAEGTLYIKAIVPTLVANGRYLSLNNNTSTIRVLDLFQATSTTINIYKSVDASNLSVTTSAVAGNQRIAARYKQNDYQSSYNGALGTPDTITPAMQTATMLELGNLANGSQLPMVIQQVAYFPDGKVDATLSGITTP